MRPPLPAPSGIPHALRDYPNFVLWRYETRDGKATKVPLTVNAERADTTDPSTWATLDVAYSAARAGGWGLGFVFSADDPFCGIDLDKCVVGPDHDPGLLLDFLDIVTGIESYTEFSPSVTGVHIIARATLPPGGRRKGQVEMYDRKRFFTLTGRALLGLRTVEERQGEVAALHAQLFPPPPPPTPARAHQSDCPLSDQDVIDRAMRAHNGDKFRRLWEGDTTDYTSTSEADAALCSLLAFWVGPDPERVAQLFRRSALARPKFERATYRERTLALAGRRSAYYSPRRKSRTYLGG